jgi:hypothetical protein
VNHTINKKLKLLPPVLRGQIETVKRALQNEMGCAEPSSSWQPLAEQ